MNKMNKFLLLILGIIVFAAGLIIGGYEESPKEEVSCVNNYYDEYIELMKSSSKELAETRSSGVEKDNLEYWIYDQCQIIITDGETPNPDIYYNWFLTDIRLLDVEKQDISGRWDGSSGDWNYWIYCEWIM